MLAAFFSIVAGTFTALFPIVNPFSAAPVLVAITADMNDAARNAQIRRACIFATVILAVALLAGSLIMNFFGLSIPGLRIAGGILVAGIGMRMLYPKDEDTHTEEEKAESKAKDDISFTPLAMPLLAGPGAIAVTIGMASLASGPLHYGAVLTGILLVMLSAFVVLRMAEKMVKFLGVNGLHAMTKIMGFLLLCVGVQFIVNGVIGVATDHTLWEKFHVLEKL